MTDQTPDVAAGRRDAERDQAERRYVAALAALDTAAEPSATVASAAAAAATDALRVRDVWNGPGSPATGPQAGIVSRALAEIGRLLPWRRRRLLGAMIAAINRNTDATRALIDATQHFQSHVIWYAQTIAALAAAPRRGDTGPKGVEALHDAINALGADWMTRWESLAAREQRYEIRMAALTKAHADLQEVASLAQQSTLSLKRTVESLSPAAASAPPVASAASPASGDRPAGPDVDAFKYVGFEDRFRGSREDIRQRLIPYLPLFEGRTNILDVGCGRGELLDLLREHGANARGIDTNEEMVAGCRARGLAAEQADALAFLQALPDGSLGGLAAIQVVEHFEPGYLVRFLETAHHKLAPGAPLVLETINPACWTAFFDSYIRDLTHARPLHPDTLKYLAQASGFATADVQFQSPVAEDEKLPLVGVAPAAYASDPALTDLVDTLNAHAMRLNSRLFTYRDYAIVARR